MRVAPGRRRARAAHAAAGARGRRVAVGVRAHHLRRRRPAAHPRVRRVRDPQPRRGGRAARRAGEGHRRRRHHQRRARPSSGPTAGRRSSWCRPRPTSSASSAPTRPASATAPGFRWWEVAGTAHADKFQVGAGGRRARLPGAGEQRTEPLRRPDGAPRPRPVGAHRRRAAEGAAVRDRRGDEDLRPRRVGQREGRHPHAARRRARRHALGRVGRRVGGVHPVRLHQAVDRRAARRSGTAHATTTDASTAPRRSGRSPPASCSPTTGPTCMAMAQPDRIPA